MSKKNDKGKDKSKGKIVKKPTTTSRKTTPKKRSVKSQPQQQTNDNYIKPSVKEVVRRLNEYAYALEYQATGKAPSLEKPQRKVKFDPETFRDITPGTNQWRESLPQLPDRFRWGHGWQFRNVVLTKYAKWPMSYFTRLVSFVTGVFNKVGLALKFKKEIGNKLSTLRKNKDSKNA